MTDVTIWHNPSCGTSRTALAMLREAGIEPVVVPYLKTPPDRATLAATIAAAGLTVRQALRTSSASATRRCRTARCWTPCWRIRC